MSKHVVITGGSGFIGSHLCDQLLAKGYAVTAIDNMVTGREANLEEAKKNKKFQLIQGDICIPETWSKLAQSALVKEFAPMGVLHFACPASPIDFEKIPYVILEVDSIGTKHAVEFALKHQARLVLASTSEIYGDPLEHPQKETYFGNVNSIGPRACYDEAKRFSEAYVSTAVWFSKLNGGMVRIFNTYGPRMRIDDGRVVPEFFRRALKNEPIPVHGDGLQTRSFCYVSDLVEGIVRYFESQEKDPVNLGNPDERTMVDFAQVVKRLSKSDSKIVHEPPRPDDPKQRKPDITRANTRLGWRPEVSLDQGLAKTFEYFQSQSF